MRNLNIKSDEAYQLATDIARRTGKNLTLVVTEALREKRRLLTRDELTKKWDAIMINNRARLSKEFLNENSDNFLYDEMGLPK